MARVAGPASAGVPAPDRRGAIRQLTEDTATSQRILAFSRRVATMCSAALEPEM
jgi:hypothetical protein